MIVSSLLFGACSHEDRAPQIVKAAENLAVDTADPDINAALAAINRSPNLATGYTRLASLYIRRARASGDFGLNTQAQAAVDRALGVDAANLEARKLQASLHLTFHRFSEALDAGTRLLADSPNDAFIYAVLTDANVELGNYPEAIQAAQSMVDSRPNTTSYARVAHIRSLHGDHKGAVEMYIDAARSADPLDREAQSWCLAQLADEKMKYGKYAEAERIYDEADQILPGFHLARLGKARARAALGDLEAAAAILEELQNRLPNTESVILLADIYTRLGATEKANRQAELVEIIEAKLGVANDQKRLAVFWADRDIKLAEALAITEREHAARKDIFTADAHAWCLLKNGRVEEAKTTINEAIRLKTNDARMLYHAGMIENAAGNKNGAKRLLALALRTNPKFDALQSAIAESALDALQ